MPSRSQFASCEMDGANCPVTMAQEYPSPAVVTHGDGTLVSSTSPAAPGETVVAYAFGLGTDSGVTTGAAVSAPTTNAQFPAFNLHVQFDFRPNAPGAPPYVKPFAPLPPDTFSPVYAGLTVGQIGLYQINIKLPDSFPAHLPCDLPGIPAGPNLNPPVVSNLTIDIGGVSSFDGAAICVLPSQ